MNSEQNAEIFMREAIQLSVDNVEQGKGGPFGAVSVKDGKIIAHGTNEVTCTNDPTAHAEVVAIRNAGKALNSFDLMGCEIYASCEPCPMCLAAIYWARIDKLYFASTKHDAATSNFDDQLIYDELTKPIEERQLFTRQLLREEALEAFRKWEQSPNKTGY